MFNPLLTVPYCPFTYPAPPENPAIGSLERAVIKYWSPSGYYGRSPAAKRLLVYFELKQTHPMFKKFDHGHQCANIYLPFCQFSSWLKCRMKSFYWWNKILQSSLARLRCCRATVAEHRWVRPIAAGYQSKFAEKVFAGNRCKKHRRRHQMNRVSNCCP